MSAPLASPLPTPVQLLRRWVVDYFNGHNGSAAREFIAPEYALEIGDHLFAGRDTAWLPAVAEQMVQYPSLGMTVHQVLAGPEQVAVWFSEHGARGGAGGPQAVWSGVGIYRAQGAHVVGCCAQEDYTTRSRQLREGVCDPVDAPAVAPWDTVPLPPDAEAEQVVRRWLGSAWPVAEPGVRCDDDHLTGRPLRFAVEATQVLTLFSSGPEVAFQVRQRGRYLGGLPGVPARERSEMLHSNGIVRVQGGEVLKGRVIRDRGGLKARLLQD